MFTFCYKNYTKSKQFGFCKFTNCRQRGVTKFPATKKIWSQNYFDFRRFLVVLFKKQNNLFSFCLYLAEKKVSALQLHFQFFPQTLKWAKKTTKFCKNKKKWKIINFFSKLKQRKCKEGLGGLPKNFLEDLEQFWAL